MTDAPESLPVAAQASGLRTAYDAVTPSQIPAGAQMVLYYANGRYAWSAADLARFPNAVKGSISVTASDLGPQILDVENGDATPEQGLEWVRAKRARGEDPSVYASISTWDDALVPLFARAGEPLPHAWKAGYRNPPAPYMAAGAVATQYMGGMTAPYDVSLVAAYWPGIDAAPQPSPTPPPVVRPTGDAQVPKEITLTINVAPDPGHDGFKSAGYNDIGEADSSIISVEVGGQDPAHAGTYVEFDEPTHEAIAVGITRVQLTSQAEFTGPVTVRVFCLA